MNNPQIYITDMAAYNAGMLRGEWIDANQEAEELADAVKNMLLESPESNIPCTVCKECGHIEHYATLPPVKGVKLADINGWTTDRPECEICGSNDLRQTVTAEEFFISDTDGIDVGEYESLDKVSELAACIEEYGEAYQAYIDLIGAEYATPENFEEAYTGEYSSDIDFAQDMAEQFGVTEITQEYGTNWPNYCIDWEHAARELMYDYAESNGHYFRNI